MKSSPKTFQEAASICSGLLLRAGFDLVQSLSLPAEVLQRPLVWQERWTRQLLPSWTQTEAVEGFLVGNSRQLWQHFRSALRSDSALTDQAHPLDSYTTRQVEQATAPLREYAGDAAHVWTGYAHLLTPLPLPMTRLADACGLGRLGPAGLVVHPVFGPWIALRAIVLVRADRYVPPGPEAPHPCDGCLAPCAMQARRARGLAASRPHRADQLPLGPVLPQLSPRARLWLAVRDVCPLGTDQRYCPAQISYHYDKDRSQLTVE